MDIAAGVGVGVEQPQLLVINEKGVGQGVQSVEDEMTQLFVMIEYRKKACEALLQGLDLF